MNMRRIGLSSIAQSRVLVCVPPQRRVLAWGYAWLLACLLLWVQFAAFAHALEHLDGDAGETPACEWCAAYANVQHGAASLPACPLPAVHDVSHECSVAHSAAAVLTPVYRSRAPPRRLV
ncbi:MAG: hypothetical protein ACUVT2_03630 [Thiobacillaceae bacterium]